MSDEKYIRSLKLVNFKGFASHVIHFARPSASLDNILIGANNAGKSTVLEALRLFAFSLASAGKRNEDTVGRLRGSSLRGWTISKAAQDLAGFSDENLRYEFNNAETVLELTTRSGVKAVISWGLDGDDGGDPPFLSIHNVDGGRQATGRNLIRNFMPAMGVVPTLTPLERREIQVSAETLARTARSRRSSRHFRNRLHLLSHEDFERFSRFVCENTPEIMSLSLASSITDHGRELDLFYQESDTRREREIGWAGDGLHVWLQVIYNIWSQPAVDVFLLDEPDVFLHPDLQRRAARLVLSQPCQTITATHSEVFSPGTSA